jgi:acetyl-CoA carboxylase biotin carboxylase subunit
MFKKVLIANRGEIAVRIIRTAQEMGIATVAVYSDADRRSQHVLQAGEAVHIGDSDPLSSYLNIDRIVDAAKKSGAEAIHPGYGFLAENPVFAQHVTDEGLIFVGPPADVMAKLGDKTSARHISAQGNVPIIPGMIAREQGPGELLASAEQIGYPVLIKAAAGGGGKGMRVAQDAEQIAELAELAASEALTAFGDGSIYLEKYLDRPRHVEFQILADAYGNVIHLHERECSIQRRYQKIIEETPSPVLDHELRHRMGQAAVAAAQAAGYVNAGTVEFLLDQEGNFYFLEVNTRLQVEHPITEMTTGLDLVRRQFEIAAGEELPFRQEDIRPRGHAIECRIYAEDPQFSFMPSPGKILLFRTAEGPGVRFDHGIYTGFDVPVDYDPILGKLIAFAEDRPSAIRRMVRALQDTVILGVTTTTEFLLDVLVSEQFALGQTHTTLIDESFADWTPDPAVDELAAVGYRAYDEFQPQVASPSWGTGAQKNVYSPWQALGAWDIAR